MPKDERRELIASVFPQGAGLLRVFQGRCVDAEEPHASDRRDLDGIAVDDGTNEHRVGAFEIVGG
jgi:hypothetical protein